MSAKYEDHPIRESLRTFGKVAIGIGALAVGAAILL